MRRRTRRIFALVSAAVLATMSAASGMALTTTTSGAYSAADVDSSKVIPAGWPSYQDATDCVWNPCDHLKDRAFVDVDISNAMADYEDSAHFYVVNGFVSQTTYWFVCSYDADGFPLDCWYDGERSWGMMGELSPDAHELRVFPIQSAASEYHLYVYVD